MTQDPTSPPYQDKRFAATSLHGPITQEFLDEAEQFKLRFLCEDCIHFDEANELCLHHYPTPPHRKRYFEEEPLGKTLIFCREFDLY